MIQIEYIVLRRSESVGSVTDYLCFIVEAFRDAVRDWHIKVGEDIFLVIQDHFFLGLPVFDTTTFFEGFSFTVLTAFSLAIGAVLFFATITFFASAHM